MHSPEPHESAVVALLAGIVVLATPLRLLWLRDAGPWWMPFAVWAGLVLLAVVTSRRASR